MKNMSRSRMLYRLLTLAILLFQETYCDAPYADSASLPLEHRAVYGTSLSSGSNYGPPPIAALETGLGALGGGGGGGIGGGGGGGGGGGVGGGGGDDFWLASPDMPKIKHLQVQCEKTHMRVNIEFDRPFYGMIFSKGFYSDSHCVHLKAGTGHLSATFEIFLNSCGMSSSVNHNAVAEYAGSTSSGNYVENTIIIQYDPYVQEVWDQARKLRCTWYDFYEKSVNFRPFQVDMLHAVMANFLGDNLQCWMQIQVGKGPWASEVSGIVKIGQTMTMVLAIKDDENKFDMLVRNCVAHDGKRTPIQLVDEYGCVVRPKIMSRFQKVKNFGPSASVVSFAYFQAFKFPDSMNVHFQCVIQVCRYNCPEPKCGGHHPGLEYDTSLSENSVLGGYEHRPQAYPVEYGPPAAFPDPRHPSGPSGAYSEQKADIVPPPQAQVAAPSSTSNPSNISSSIPPANEIHLPPPPLPGRFVYNTVKRKDVNDELEGNLATLGGRPRSVENFPSELDSAANNQRRRRRRKRTTDTTSDSTDGKKQEMTDVNTSRIIQVVAPGDVNFALNAAQNNETVVIQSTSGQESETICMSIPSFVAGLVMLLLVLIVASLVSAFLFIRVRAIDKKEAQTYINTRNYTGSDFIKITN